MNNGFPIRRLIFGLILAGLLVVGWVTFGSHSYLNVQFDTGINRAQLEGSGVNRSVTAGWLHLSTGDYVVTYYREDGSIASLQAHHVGPLSFGMVSPHVQAPTQKSLIFLSHPADLITPLGNGYVYRDKVSRALNYADEHGTVNITSNLRLTTSPSASLANSDSTVYNTVINIEPIKSGGVVITTTRGIFMMPTASSVVALPIDNDNFPNYTASAYDAQTNSLFVAQPRSPIIYRYDLSKPKNTATSFYKGELAINRLAAGGGKVVAYYDAVPSIEPAVLAQYAIKYQIVPLVLDISTQKVIGQLEDYAGATSITVSGSGQYLAIKRKLASTLVIYNLTNRRTTSLPSFDAGGVGWRDNTLFLARDRTIWRYDSDGSFVAQAATPGPVTRLLVTDTTIILTTIANTTARLEPLSATQVPIIPATVSSAATPYLYYAAPFETNNH